MSIVTHQTPQGMTGRTQRSNVTTLRRLGRRKQRNMKGDLFELKHHCLIWEFKKRRRRRHGRSRFKNELILYLRVSQYSKVTLETEHETQR